MDDADLRYLFDQSLIDCKKIPDISTYNELSFKCYKIIKVLLNYFIKFNTRIITKEYNLT